MLLDKMDKYIQEVEIHDKVWKAITAAPIDIEDLTHMSKEERDEIFDILDEKLQEQIRKLEEGGLL